MSLCGRQRAYTSWFLSVKCLCWFWGLFICSKGAALLDLGCRGTFLVSSHSHHFFLVHVIHLCCSCSNALRFTSDMHDPPKNRWMNHRCYLHCSCVKMRRMHHEYYLHYFYQINWKLSLAMLSRNWFNKMSVPSKSDMKAAIKEVRMSFSCFTRPDIISGSKAIEKSWDKTQGLIASSCRRSWSFTEVPLSQTISRNDVRCLGYMYICACGHCDTQEASKSFSSLKGLSRCLLIITVQLWKSDDSCNDVCVCALAIGYYVPLAVFLRETHPDSPPVCMIQVWCRLVAVRWEYSKPCHISQRPIWWSNRIIFMSMPMAWYTRERVSFATLFLLKCRFICPTFMIGQNDPRS